MAEFIVEELMEWANLSDSQIIKILDFFQSLNPDKYKIQRALTRKRIDYADDDKYLDGIMKKAIDAFYSEQPGEWIEMSDDWWYIEEEPGEIFYWNTDKDGNWDIAIRAEAIRGRPESPDGPLTEDGYPVPAVFELTMTDDGYVLYSEWRLN